MTEFERAWRDFVGELRAALPVFGLFVVLPIELILVALIMFGIVR